MGLRGSVGLGFLCLLNERGILVVVSKLVSDSVVQIQSCWEPQFVKHGKAKSFWSDQSLPTGTQCERQWVRFLPEEPSRSPAVLEYCDFLMSGESPSVPCHHDPVSGTPDSPSDQGWHLALHADSFLFGDGVGWERCAGSSCHSRSLPGGVGEADVVRGWPAPPSGCPEWLSAERTMVMLLSLLSHPPHWPLPPRNLHVDHSQLLPGAPPVPTLHPLPVLAHAPWHPRSPSPALMLLRPYWQHGPIRLVRALLPGTPPQPHLAPPRQSSRCRLSTVVPGSKLLLQHFAHLEWLLSSPPPSSTLRIEPLALLGLPQPRHALPLLHSHGLCLGSGSWMSSGGRKPVARSVICLSVRL